MTKLDTTSPPTTTEPLRATVVDGYRALQARLIDINTAGGAFMVASPPAPRRPITVIFARPGGYGRSVWARAIVEWSVEQKSARVLSGFGCRWRSVESSCPNALRRVLGEALSSSAGRVEVFDAITASGRLYRFRPARESNQLPIPAAPASLEPPVGVAGEPVLLPATVSTPRGERRATVFAVAEDRIWLTLGEPAAPSGGTAAAPEPLGDAEVYVETAFASAGALHPLRLHGLTCASAGDASGAITEVALEPEAPDHAPYLDFVRFLAGG